MKKLIFFLLLLLSTASLSAQSESPSDSIRHLPSTVKQYGDFLIDMGLFMAAPPKLPEYKFELPDTSKDYSRIFSLNPDIIMTQGLSNVFTPSLSYGFGGFFSSPQQLQMGSFKLKNGMRLNTYGEYNAKGQKVPNHGAMPWEKNNFKGAFEMKSSDGNFGIRIEVQQGRYYPY